MVYPKSPDANVLVYGLPDSPLAGGGPPYVSCCRLTISAIQIGAYGEVQFGGVG